MDAKVTGTFEKWEPTTLDVDTKPFPLRNRTKFVPRALGKAPWAWGRGRNRTTRPILGTSGFSHPANLCRGIWNPGV